MSKGKHIRAFDYVNQPYESVRETLHDNASKVLQLATSAAASRAHTVASGLHVNIGGIELGAEIDISVTAVDEEPEGPLGGPVTRVDVEWEAARAERFFPFMRGRLSAYALSGKETQLDFEGDYEPPLGLIGSAVDAVVGHRIADAAVHRFVTDVATHLRTALATP